MRKYKIIFCVLLLLPVLGYANMDSGLEYMSFIYRPKKLMNLAEALNTYNFQADDSIKKERSYILFASAITSTDPDKKIEDLTEALKLNDVWIKDNRSFVFLFRGSFYGDLNIDDKAIEDYNEALKLDDTFLKNYRSLVLNNRGIFYHRLGRYKVGEKSRPM